MYICASVCVKIFCIPSISLLLNMFACIVWMCALGTAVGSITVLSMSVEVRDFVPTNSLEASKLV